MSDDAAGSAMEAEFATMASWTADAAVELGPAHYLPAACRGSGGPRTLDLLLDGLGAAPGTRLLDVGAGVGGPASYAALAGGLRPVALEPEIAACRAAARLFGTAPSGRVDVIAGDALALPFPDGSFAAAWCLGVLCTVADHTALLTEIARVMTPGGRVALLVFVAQRTLPDQPEGNTFPTETALRTALRAADLRLVATQPMIAPDEEDAAWVRRGEEVDDAVRTAHGHEQAWRQAEAQTRSIGRLLAEDYLAGRVVHLVRDAHDDH